MKKIIGFLLVVGMTALFALPALSMPQGAARLKFRGKDMPAVDFPHKSHKEYISDCTECHHMGVGTGTCVDCHDGSDSRIRSKKNAFHDSCMNCHLKKKVSKKNDCGFCHKG